LDKLTFQNVDLVLADSSAMIRQGLKGALFTKGFRDIIDTDNLETIRETISGQSVDILICDTDFPDGDACALTHDIRHHRVGNNPFMVVIMLVDSPDKETIMRVVNCGTDDVVLKPISAAKLFERVDMLARKRKRFVVTSDYIGPSRRDSHRPGTMKIPELDVPNPVKAKVEGKVAKEAIQGDIDSITAVINQQKMERYAFQVGYLVDRIVPLYEHGTVDMGIVQHLDRLEWVSEDLSRRAAGTPFDHVNDLCESMAAVAAGIRKMPLAPEQRDIRLLPQLARAIQRAFSPDEKAAKVAHDISESVKKRSN
jgi:DNA-binding response OmpR family regulator